MKKNGMLTVDNTFVDGNLRNVVSAKPNLEKMYKELRDVLSDFFHTASNLDSYIKYAEEATDIRKSHDDMYPDEGN